MTISVLVGSVSSNSYNMKLAKFLFKDREGYEILSLKDFPIYSMDIEENPQEIVKDYREKIKNSKGVVIVTPEYNYSIPGVLKNALDWFSRVDFVLENKPVMIMGASMSSMGTVRAQTHLRAILDAPTLKAMIMPGNEIHLGPIQDLMDDEGNIKDKSTVDFLNSKIKKFEDWILDVQDLKY